MEHFRPFLLIVTYHVGNIMTPPLVLYNKHGQMNYCHDDDDGLNHHR